IDAMSELDPMNANPPLALTRFAAKALLPTTNSLLTLLFVLAAVGVGVLPNASSALSYQRETIAQGQVWGLATGHVTHWSTDHLMWDVLMFGVLCILVEQESRARAARLLFSSMLAISLVLWCTAPEVSEYRGLSGIDSALFAYVAARQARAALT